MTFTLEDVAKKFPLWCFPISRKLLYTPAGGGGVSAGFQGWVFVLECSPRRPKHDGMLGFQFGYRLIVDRMSHIRRYLGSICSDHWIDFIFKYVDLDTSRIV